MTSLIYSLESLVQLCQVCQVDLPTKRMQASVQAGPAHPDPPKVYFTVSRTTSSMVVWPSAIFWSPLRLSVSMPSSIAYFLISIAEAPSKII